MPKIKVEKVLTFSTEDPQNPAINLLSTDPAKKWKCANAGEKNANVVLQLDKATQIVGIDIGNEGSAYVEVLVSRSSSDEYKVLLGMSSFMTPFEARQNQNINKVRMFATKDLSEPECYEKWDRVKIVCIQPYNKHMQYGLSFVAIHTNEGVLVDKKNIGKFTLRPDSPTAYSIGSLFSREKEAMKTTTSLKGAAAIREASAKPSLSPYKPPLVVRTTARPSTSKDTDNDDLDTSVSSLRNRNSLLYTEDDEAPNEKIDKLIETKKVEDEERRKEEKVKNNEKKTARPAKQGESAEPKKRKTDGKLSDDETPKKRRTQKESCKDESDRQVAGPSRRNKRQSMDDEAVEKMSPKKKAKVSRLSKPYEKLLEGVVIVISGIQNPERANLRTSALAMGAKYKADWDSSCTHLICAFANTPKFNQVRGKGTIVKKQWIVECDKTRKRLPWRRFALDRNDQTGVESEEEVWEQVEVSDSNEAETEIVASDTDEEIERIQRKQVKEQEQNEDRREQSDDEQDNAKEQKQPVGKKNHNKNTCKTNGDAIVDTNETGGLPVLPNYFSNIAFYLSPNLGPVRKQFVKYLVAYDGKIIENYEDIKSTDVAILYSDDEDEKKQIAKRTQKLVSPTWLLECHNKKCFLPFDNYLL